MLIAKEADQEHFGRTLYALDGKNMKVTHFSVRKATKEHPFKNHKHEQEELWFVFDGEGMVDEDGEKYPVKKGDLIHLKSWVEHGITTENEVTFVCLG
jgi:quercetin dioxygenase-like cupin family protein